MVKSKTKLMRIAVDDAEYLKKLKDKNKLDSSSAALKEIVNFFEMNKKKKRTVTEIIRRLEF